MCRWTFSGMPWSGNKPFEFQFFYLKMLKSLRTFCSKTIISFNLDKKYHNIQLNFKASNAENKAWWSLYNTVQSGIVLLILSSQRFKNSVGRKCAKIEKDVFRLVNSEIFLFVPRSPQSFFLCPTLVTWQKTSFSISMPSSKLTISLILLTNHGVKM